MKTMIKKLSAVLILILSVGLLTANSADNPDSKQIYKSHDLQTSINAMTPVWDTISGFCFALTASDNGNLGHEGIGEVNLDYFNFGDCDTVDTIPGDTRMYLYDGSPIVTWSDGLDTTASFAMYTSTINEAVGFKPITPHTPTVDMGTHYELQSGIFTTADTTIGLEQTLFMPKGSGNDCFVIKRLKIFSYDGETHSGITVGEGLDWDIPTDSLIKNRAGFDDTRQLIYQYGTEYNTDNSVECLENSDRYGGVAFLEKFFKTYNQDPDTLYVYTALATAAGGLSELQSNIDAALSWYSANITTATDSGTVQDADFVGAYVLDNQTWVYPTNTFKEAQLYYNMRTLHLTDQYVVTPAQYTDLHTIMTYVNDLELGGAGCCLGLRGNANNDPADAVNIADITYLVNYLFGIPSGPPPLCAEEANANSDPAELANIADITYLVNYLFGIPSGPPPQPCP